jgi:hypothetical protein
MTKMEKEILPVADNGRMGKKCMDWKNVFPCNYFYLDGWIPAANLEEVRSSVC